jgi:dipeptidyl aminopeptidase/acylaminoacyl peptidase
MKTIIKILVFTFLFIQQLDAQESKDKKIIDFSVWDKWKTIEDKRISNDGAWVAYEVNPYKGDGLLVIMNPEKLVKIEVSRGTNAVFSSGSKFIAYKIQAQQDSIRKLKVSKVKKEKFPKDSLCIRILKGNNTYYYDSLQSFKVPEGKSDWIVISQFNKEESGSSKPTKKPKNAPETYRLKILNPINSSLYQFNNVSEYYISENGKQIAFVQVNALNKLESKINVFNIEKESLVKIFETTGLAKKLTLDSEGKQAAFLFSSDSIDNPMFDLYLWNASKNAMSELVIGKNTLDLPKDWIVSEFGDLWFSKDGLKLYFGAAIKPEPEKKDTLLDEEKVNLDVWSWTDPLLQSQQLVELKKELKRTFICVYLINKKNTANLADEFIKEALIVKHGNSDVALGIAESPFQKERSWSYPWYKDVYLIDVNKGNKKLIIEKTASDVKLSPFGGFVFWFDNQDSCWYTINAKTKERNALTKKIPVNFYDEEYDRPSTPPSYDFAGWTENDRYFLVYDRYDIWKLDPNGKESPINITKGFGRKNKIELRYLSLNSEADYINSKEELLLVAFNKDNKQGGYYSTFLNSLTDPIKLFMDDYSFSGLIKAKESSAMIWQKGSAKEFPDIWYSSNKFSEPFKISRANPQQDEYLWHTVELVKWKTFDGKEEEGLLYKPENFVPWKKYPMIVTFYELRSDRLHSHYYPRPSLSPANILEYTSNGYLVFIPNIRYTAGNPGECAVNYVVSGTKSIIEKGYVDRYKIGIQGQSWGAYQLAYIITQTDIFKAACAVAPVSNMTSAYGDIYWKYGYSRMSMYESDQSRIGSNLWEKPELYIQNSPIFYADKIETPLMIVHNDGDNAVPWTQGIQLFVALRRLSKPVWLLNYNGEQHNLRDRSPASKDFSIRMFQFFEHFLLDKPAPKWLIEGIPAVKKGKELGLEVEEPVQGFMGY